MTRPAARFGVVALVLVAVGAFCLVGGGLDGNVHNDGRTQLRASGEVVYHLRDGQTCRSLRKDYIPIEVAAGVIRRGNVGAAVQQDALCLFPFVIPGPFSGRRADVSFDGQTVSVRLKDLLGSMGLPGSRS